MVTTVFGAYQTGAGSGFLMTALENCTSTTCGSDFEIITTAAGTAAQGTVAYFKQGFSVGTSTDPGTGTILANKGIGTVPTTFASLPTCNAAYEGQRAYITDQNTAVAYRGATSGGGTTRQAVLCSNSAWIQD